MGNSSGRDTREAATEEKRQKALQLRIGRLSYQAIATHMGVSKSYAVKLVKSALADLNDKTLENAAELRKLENTTLDRLQLAVWSEAQKGNTDAVRTVLEIMNKRARLNALDAPIKIENTSGVSLDAVLAAQKAAEKNG